MPPIREKPANSACRLFYLWLFNFICLFSFDAKNLVWMWLYQFLSTLIYFEERLSLKQAQEGSVRIQITKTYLNNPLKPHFYIVKLGFTGVCIISLFLLKNIDCGYSLEPPRRGGSNEYPQSIFLSRNMKNISFLSKNFQFLEVKYSIYLNRRVFVMRSLFKRSDETICNNSCAFYHSWAKL